MQDKLVKKEPKKMVGVVVSDKMNKTITVEVTRTYTDARLKKVLRTSKKYKVHDEQELAGQGDVVEIYEGRPRSKNKYMYLGRVMEQAHATK